MILRRSLSLAILFASLCGATSARAQFLGTGPRDKFRDTSILRPPAGAKVAIIVFEDLGCPGCARAHPYELEAVKQTHVPLLRHDFPIPAHIWTFQGALLARYIEDKISPQLAGQYRTDVFASQRMIGSKDDINQFTAVWLKKRGKQLPMVIDPDGSLARKVNADVDLGKRLNLGYTPTLVVVTRNAYQVICGTGLESEDAAQLLPVVKAALASVK